MLSLFSPRYWVGIALLLGMGAWAQPAGLKTWVVSPIVKLTETTTRPDNAADAVVLTLPRNGIASGVVVQAAATAYDGAAAQMSDLTRPAGARIPAAAVRLRYADVKPAWTPLFEEPVKARMIHPVWLTVHVPADATPGAYTGELTCKGAAKPVPVQLTVVDWTMPDARDWQVWVQTLQSPESVAATYKVPLWSDEHFALLEESLKLMGDLGNDIIDVRAVRRTSIGDDPVLMFQRDAAGELQPEFTAFNRYLDLYQKYCGKPKFLIVNVWNENMNLDALGRGRGVTSKEQEVQQIGIAELKDGKIIDTLIPMHDRPGSEAIWQRMMDGLRDQLRQRGMSEYQIILGQGNDIWPSPFTVDMFRKVAPYAQWVSLTHGQGAPKWSYTDVGRTQPNGMVTGIMEMARLLPTNKPHVPGHPVLCNARDNVGDSPAVFRSFSRAIIFENNHDGVCWKGIDFWPYRTEAGTIRSALASYSGMGNTVGGSPRAIAAIGPKGAVATQQLEMWRECNEETEAIYTMRAALDARFPPPTIYCDMTELSLDRGVKGKYGYQALTLTIANKPDGTLIIEPQARGYNTGVRTGAGKVTTEGDKMTFDIDIDLGIDNMTGKYTIEVTRADNRFQGKYTGKIFGTAVSGAVTGSFMPKGYPFAANAPTPKAPDQLKADKIFDDLMLFYKTGWALTTEAKEVAALYNTTAELVRAGK